MKILLNEIEYKHLELIARVDLHRIFGGFGIISAEFKDDHKRGVPFPPHNYSLEVEGQMTLQGWQDYIKYLRSL